MRLSVNLKRSQKRKGIYGQRAWRSRVIRFSVLFFVMDDVSELHLVPNRCGDMSLVYEGMNKLRYTGLVYFGIRQKRLCWCYMAKG
ncbi:Nuclear cap-binding protein subunit [Trichinella pseudospiralis]